MFGGYTYHLLYTQSIGILSIMHSGMINQNSYGLSIDSSFDYKPKLIGGLRLLNNDLYFYPFSSFPLMYGNDTFPANNEVILYDFNPHNISDTISWKADSNVILSIDSTMLPNGFLVKNYTFINLEPYQTFGDWWTVGIGSSKGLFGAYSNIDYFATGYYAQCYINKDFTISSGSTITPAYLHWPCNNTLSVAATSPIQPVSIYPNPVNDELHIDDLQTQYSYRLQGLEGNVFQKGILQRGNHTLYLTNIPTGLYLLLLQSDNEKRVVKIVKD